MSESVILEEEIDPNYEPTEEEILEYATWLGMDPEIDEEYLYIAKEGLKAPLPEPWKPCKTKEGEIYYFNFENGESVWEHPCDEYYKGMFEEKKANQYRNRSAKKSGKKASPEKKGKAADPVSIIDNFSIPSKQKNFAFEPGGKIHKREDDTLIRLEKEKQLRRQQEDAHLQFQEELDAVEEDFEYRKEKLQRKLDDEMVAMDREHQMELDNIEFEIRREFQKGSDGSRQSLRREFDVKEDEERRAQQEKFEHQMKELKSEFDRRLQNQKDLARDDFDRERKSLASKEEKQIIMDIDELKQEVKYQKERVQREEIELNEAESRFHDKYSRIKQDHDDNIRRERTRQSSDLRMSSMVDDELIKREKDIESIESELNVGRVEIDLRIKEARLKIEQEYDIKLGQIRKDTQDRNKETSVLLQAEHNSQAHVRDDQERAKIDSSMQRKRDDMERNRIREVDDAKHLSEIQRKDELLRVQKGINIDLEGEHRRMEIEAQRKIETLRGQSPHVDAQAKLMELQKEFSRLQNEIFMTDQEISFASVKQDGLNTNISQLEEQMSRIESEPSHQDLINNLQKQIEDKNSEIRMTTGSPDLVKLGKMESDISDIKESIVGMQTGNYSPSKTPRIDAESVGRWKQIIIEEKQKLRDQQMNLEQDRQMWKMDANDCVQRPYSNPAKKAELTSVKKVLDTQARMINSKIHEVRYVETWIRGKGVLGHVPNFEIEEDVMVQRIAALDAGEEDLITNWKLGREIDSSLDVSQWD